MTESPAKTRWRRRPTARPDEILDAALEEFIAKGFDAARMQDVARRAGISKAGVYLYFDAKEALLRALITREVAPIAARARALAAAGVDRPEETLTAIASGALALLSNPRTFAVPRLVISISGRFPEIADYYRQNVIEPTKAALQQLIEAGIEQGAFRPVDPHAAARAVIGPLMFEVLWCLVMRGGDGGKTDQDALAAWADLLFNGLRPETKQ